jgi:hypothetical protein
MENERPFGQALDALARSKGYVNRLGNVNWADLARDIPGIHYETLRKALAGERQLDHDFLERLAEGLGVPADYFVEWRLWDAQRRFDPREVGYDEAVANLTEWLRKNGAERRASRRRRPA